MGTNVLYAAFLLICLVDARSTNPHASFSNPPASSSNPPASSTDLPAACKPLPSPDHGTTVCNDLGYLLVCTASCDNGFEFESLSPVERRYCSSYTNTWLNGDAFPSCRVHKPETDGCQSVTPPINGVVRCERSASELICSAQCNSGFIFENHHTLIQRVCETFDGVWYNGKDFPKCVIDRGDCQPSHAPPFGIVSCNTVNLKVICTSVCQQGYGFKTGEHSVQRTCDLNTGLWQDGSKDFPACQKAATTKICQEITGDSNTQILCDDNGSELICTATCVNGTVFENKDLVIKRVCDQFDGTWFNGNKIPSCIVPCEQPIISNNKGITNSDFTASSSFDLFPAVYFGADRARINSTAGKLHLAGGWRPSVDNLDQYIQIDLKNLSRVNGIVTKGRNVVDGNSSNDFTTRFRILYSTDGIHFVSYGDDTVSDKFFAGNSDRDTPVTNMFTCPFDALYVRINPLEWNSHIGLRFELLGCDSSTVSLLSTKAPSHTITTAPSPPQVECTSPLPPQNGIMTCVKAENELVCSGLCNSGFAFQSNKTVEKLTCNLQSGDWLLGKQFPKCQVTTTVSGGSHNHSTHTHPSHTCIAKSLDCKHLSNGDYQTCGDCHFFASCSEGYVYVRPCPVYLVFDSIVRQCMYTSQTCAHSKPSSSVFGR